MKSKSWLGVICMLITTVIWGSAFVAQYLGAESLPPIAFTAARSFIGALAVLPVALLSLRREKKAGVVTAPRTLLTGGIACGAALALASSLQQAGVAQSGAGKAGFLTVLYIVIVPILGLFLRQRAGWEIWVGVAVALVGTYFLSVDAAFGIEAGDGLLLLCALVYAVQILKVAQSLTSCTWQFPPADRRIAPYPPPGYTQSDHGSFRRRYTDWDRADPRRKAVRRRCRPGWGLP